MKIDMDWIKGAAKTALAFGKKNLPSFMVGGSVGLQWLSLILMMIEAPKAAEKIKQIEEERAEEDKPEEELGGMSKLEKAAEYGKTCWPSLVSMAGSTALEICAHKNLLNHVGELYMLAQLYKDDGDKLRKQILSEDHGEKKLNQYCDQMYEEEHPVEEVESYIHTNGIPSGETLIKNETTGARYTMPIDKLRFGFDQFNDMMHDRWTEAYERALKKKLGGKLSKGNEDDAFWSEGDKPWNLSGKDDEYLKSTVYVTGTLQEFLDCIGETHYQMKDSDFGEIFQFRYYGRGPCVDYNKVVNFKDYVDPASGRVHCAVIRSLRQLGLLFIDDEALY